MHERHVSSKERANSIPMVIDVPGQQHWCTWDNDSNRLEWVVGVFGFWITNAPVLVYCLSSCIGCLRSLGCEIVGGNEYGYGRVYGGSLPYTHS